MCIRDRGKEAPTLANYTAAVKKMYGEQADKLLKVYNPANDAEVEQVATALAGDRFIGFSTWKWSDLHAKTGGKPVYRYFYAVSYTHLDVYKRQVRKQHGVG